MSGPRIVEQHHILQSVPTYKERTIDYRIMCFCTGRQSRATDFSNAFVLENYERPANCWGIFLSLFLNLPESQLGRLQLIPNSSARAVSKTPKFAHINPVLKSLHWLKIEQRIQYKVASITYKVLHQNNLLISTAFSMFTLTVLLAPLTSSLSNVLQFAHISK